MWRFFAILTAELLQVWIWPRIARGRANRAAYYYGVRDYNLSMAIRFDGHVTAANDTINTRIKFRRGDAEDELRPFRERIPFWTEAIPMFRRRAEWAEGLARKYDQEAARPWRTLDADSPGPDPPTGFSGVSGESAYAAELASRRR